MKYQRISLSSDVFIDFAYVPKGGFVLGTNITIYDHGIDDDESPQQYYFLEEFLIGKYPVTNKQYQFFTQQTWHWCPSHFQEGGGIKGRENHPVVNVNLIDALVFSRWVVEITNCTIRLPNEFQWEKAARGIDGRSYPWGEKDPNESLLN